MEIQFSFSQFNWLAIIIAALWIFFAIGIIALFENKSVKYVLINGGYMIVAFTVMGSIIGAWH